MKFKNKNKIIKFFLKLAVSLFFVSWLIVKIDWSEVLLHVGKIALWQVILYVAVLLTGIVISALKWQILAKFKGFKVTLGHCFELYLTGSFINNFMPSFIGGDAYKAYQIGKKDKKYVSAASTVVVDRIMGLLGAMVLSVMFAALNWQMVAGHKTLLVVSITVFLLLASIPLLKIIAQFSFWKKYIPGKVFEIMKNFAEYKNDKNTLIKIFFLSIAFNLVGLAVTNYVLFWGLGIQVDILDYLTVIFLVSIVSALPVSINNIGIKEWAYVTFFGFFGVSASVVVAVALLSRVIQMIVSFAALPYYLKNK